MKEISLLLPLIKQIVKKVLIDNKWGVYLREEPIEKVPMQEGPPMLKVKEISDTSLFEAIDSYEIEE
jgi:hypothetical protein